MMVLAGSVNALFAQTAGTAKAVDDRIAELEKQVEALKMEIAAIKGAASGTAPVPVSAAVAPAPTQAAAPASDPLSGISSVLGGATVTGLVDTYYAYNVNQPANRTSSFRSFDNATNQFSLNMIELGLVKTPDANSRLGYNVTFGFGNAMNIVNGSDPGGLGFAQYLKEGYLSYLAPVGKGLQIDAGKFVTPMGAEVIESNANWNYSRGLLFNYAIPFYHFGMRAKYAFNDKYAVTGYVVNGWNNIVDNFGSGKTGGVSFAWSPNKKFSVTETWLGGPGAAPTDGENWRNVSDTVISYSPTAKLSLVANGDYGRVQRLAKSVNPVEWYGAAGYVKYQLSPLYSVATRYEYYSDPDAFTTGTVQHLHEVTGTVERRFAQHLIARGEFRHDLSNQPTFTKGNRSVLGQSTVAAGLIFVLEPNR
jgi:hypothetical protein